MKKELMMNGSQHRPTSLLGVIGHGQTYLNILYLLLAFPLGTGYFIFLVTGLSLGFGMFITLAGIPILLLVLGGSWALCGFERQLATVMLKEDIPRASTSATSTGLWPRVRDHLSNRLTWTGLFYLLLKFPVGTASFTVAVTLVAVSIGLLFAPAYLWTSDPVTWGNWTFDPFPWSWVPTLVGIPLTFISLHLMNEVALWSGRLARVMLGRLH
jgi:hypothetical protein